MLATAFLVMQFIISAKAGLVNAVEGVTNVRVQQQVPAGTLIQTGSTGRIEVLLNPRSFLRLGENAQVVLDSVELTNIAVRILSGSAIIEATTIDKDNPIRVTEEQLTVLIVACPSPIFVGRQNRLETERHQGGPLLRIGPRLHVHTWRRRPQLRVPQSADASPRSPAPETLAT